MKLDELLKKITPLPWRVIKNGGKMMSAVEGAGGVNSQLICGSLICQQDNPIMILNHAYICHAANQLPKLVDSFRVTKFRLERLAEAAYPDGPPESLEIILQQARIAIAAATEVKP